MRSIWSEFVPYGELSSPAVLSLLRRYGLRVIVAVTPPTVTGAPALVKACRDAGVSVALWPMLDRRAGRWPNASNHAVFATMVHGLLDVLGDALPDELAIDLEPPIDRMQSFLGLDLAGFWPRKEAHPLQRAHDTFSGIARELHDAGVATCAAALPLVLADAQGSSGWQRVLGTPVDGIPFTRVSTMLYSSMIQGYSRGLLRRRDTRALLGVMAAATRQRYGARASVSLGAVAAGVLGDEPAYPGVKQLREDVAICRAAEIDDLILFDLTGVLARKPSEAWLDAFVHSDADAHLPRPTARCRVTLASSLLAGWPLGLWARRVGPR